MTSGADRVGMQLETSGSQMGLTSGADLTTFLLHEMLDLTVH